MHSCKQRKLVQTYDRIGRFFTGSHLSPTFTHPTFVLQRIIQQDIRKYAQNITGIVLDVGAGTGPYEHYFSKVLRYVKADIVCNGDIKPDVVCSAESLSFSQNVFDALLCFQVLEHIPNPVRFVREARVVLKNGGYLLITAPFIYSYHDRIDYQRFTHIWWEKKLVSEGFEIICIQKQGGVFVTIGTLCLISIHGFHRLPPSMVAKGALAMVKLLLLPGIVLLSVLVNAAMSLLDELDQTNEYVSNYLVLARRRAC